MTYRDDDAARTQLACSLIDEIADLERQKLDHAAIDQRLSKAKRELAAIHAPVEPAPAPRRSPGVVAHAVVFAVAATGAYLAYALVM